MRTAPALAIAACPLVLVRADEVSIPTGKLGFTLGKYLMIEGVRGTKPTDKTIKDPHSLIVDTVNGKKLRNPIHIYVRNASLGAEIRYSLRGYETGQMRGIPGEIIQKEKEFMGDTPAPQVAWHFSTDFVATSVVEPEGISVGKNRSFTIEGD